MKKKFKDENDKFEFNVVKLNLLNIIDKLKLQIDREKEKYKSFRNRVSSENWSVLWLKSTTFKLKLEDWKGILDIWGLMGQL